VLFQRQLAQLALHSALFTLFAQTTPQDTAPTTPASKVMRVPEKQEHLCCYLMHFVKPVYPRKARLGLIEGVVKLHLVFADDGSIVELRPVSGDPLLVESAMKAVQQWRVSFGRVAGRPMEHEIALSLTFSIENPPKPAYLHLANGNVIRADTVGEFEDRIEYTDGLQTHYLSPDSVTNISACARAAAMPIEEGDCVPAGGPSFNIRAIPLWPSDNTDFEIRSDPEPGLAT
jgi:Gram-negative bacterial TonB protein C-terminal